MSLHREFIALVHDANLPITELRGALALTASSCSPPPLFKSVYGRQLSLSCRGIDRFI